jgi:hypothetical protein
MSETKLSERFAEALRNGDMVRMDNETNTAIISLRIGPGEMDEVLAVLRAAEAKEDAVTEAVKEEREACAKIAREFNWQLPLFTNDDANVAADDAACACCEQITAAIRARS